jgi:transcriptional regulator with PAS, ATPase and Fis domain
LEPLKEFIHAQEMAYIRRVLAQTGDDKDQAAKLLDVSKATLYRKLAEEGAAE